MTDTIRDEAQISAPIGAPGDSVAMTAQFSADDAGHELAAGCLTPGVSGGDGRTE